METDTWTWHDHRVSDEEAQENIEVYRPLAREFLLRYSDKEGFLVQMQENVYRLTFRQVRGVMNYMRCLPLGRAILENGPKTKTPVVQSSRSPRVDEVCPDVRHKREHYAHYFPLRSSPGATKYCNGWHTLNRRSVTTRARFCKPFVRAVNSNLLHRSTHQGTLTWRPENMHQYGPSHIVSWQVGRTCTTGATPLKNGITLTVDEARAAEPFVGPAILHDALVFCPKCFPGTNYEPVAEKI